MRACVSECVCVCVFVCVCVHIYIYMCVCVLGVVLWVFPSSPPPSPPNRYSWPNLLEVPSHEKTESGMKTEKHDPLAYH